MKCKICGSEIGNRRFCNMCGAEAPADSVTQTQLKNPSESLRQSMIGQSGPLKLVYTDDGAYQEKNVLKTEQDAGNTETDGTTVLTDADSFGLYSGTVYGKQEKEEKVINEYVKAKSKKELRKEKKEKKKAEQGYVNKIPFIVTIIILAVFTVGLTVALIYFIFFGNKVYIEVLAEIDSTMYAYSEADDTVMVCDGTGKKLTGVSTADKVAADNSALIRYNENGDLVYQFIDGSETTLGSVDNYYANANLTAIVTVKNNTDSVSLGFFYEGKLLNNMGNFDSVRDVKVSDTGGYFSFCTDYTETRWENDSSLPQGGHYIQVPMNDVYIVNYNGETKKILTSEIKITPNYITSDGQLFYTDAEKKKLYIYQNGEADDVLYDAYNIIFYENLNSFLILTKDYELWYGSFAEKRQEPYLVATGVEDVYMVGGNKNFEDYRNVRRSYKVTRSCSSYDTDMLILYTKNGSTYINEPALLSDSVKLRATSEDADTFFTYEDTAYYKAGEKLYRMDKDTLISSEENKRTGEVIETYNWSEGYEVADIGDNYYDILNDGKVIFLKEGVLSYYDGNEIQTYDEGVLMCAVNDSSCGFMYIKNTGELYYSMGPETGDAEKLCDVSTVTTLAVTNETAYYIEGNGNIKTINTKDKVVTEISDTANTELILLRNKEYVVESEEES